MQGESKQLGDLRSPWLFTTYKSWDDPPSISFCQVTIADVSLLGCLDLIRNRCDDAPFDSMRPPLRRSLPRIGRCMQLMLLAWIRDARWLPRVRTTTSATYTMAVHRSRTTSWTPLQENVLSDRCYTPILVVVFFCPSCPELGSSRSCDSGNSFQPSRCMSKFLSTTSRYHGCGTDGLHTFPLTRGLSACGVVTSSHTERMLRKEPWVVYYHLRTLGKIIPRLGYVVNKRG